MSTETSQLVDSYVRHVDFPEVSGAEHLEMLQLRDKIAAMEKSLTSTDKMAVAAADRRLIQLASEFYAELSRFINFEDRQQSYDRNYISRQVLPNLHGRSDHCLYRGRSGQSV